MSPIRIEVDFATLPDSELSDEEVWAQFASASTSVATSGVHFTMDMYAEFLRLALGRDAETGSPSMQPCRCPMLVGGGIDHVDGCSRL